MAHHKRGKPKNSRSGCIMCKYWKMNGSKAAHKMKFSEYRKYTDTQDQVKAFKRGNDGKED